MAWTAVIGGLGLVLSGWAARNSAMFASGVTAIVVGFIPRARARFVYEVANTWAMKRGWIPVSEDEKPIIREFHDPRGKHDR